MNSFVKKVLCLLEKGTAKDHNTCIRRLDMNKTLTKKSWCKTVDLVKVKKFTRGSVADFVVLGLRQLDHQLGHLANQFRKKSVSTAGSGQKLVK